MNIVQAIYFLWKNRTMVFILYFAQFYEISIKFGKKKRHDINKKYEIFF